MKSESEITQSCLTLCDPIDCKLLGSSIHRILQARILEWVAISFSRGSSWPRAWTQVSCIAVRHFTIWATPVGSPAGSVGRMWLSGLEEHQDLPYAWPWVHPNPGNRSHSSARAQAPDHFAHRIQRMHLKALVSGAVPCRSPFWDPEERRALQGGPVAIHFCKVYKQRVKPHVAQTPVSLHPTSASLTFPPAERDMGTQVGKDI